MPRSGLIAILLIATCSYGTRTFAQNDCKKPLYLTFDTGHMEIAPLVAQVLQRQDVRVTFFAANETTRQGDGSLGQHWAPWWKARAAEGHAFASHTWDHMYWRQDEGTAAAPRFRVQPSEGPHKGQRYSVDAAQYCAQIGKSAERLQVLTGQKPLPLFRAPGGKTSPQLLEAARACGYAHVAWAPAGFLGDELPSERYSNALLLRQALERIRSGDILLAHLGIWSRKDPWAPAVLEPLIVGLKERGFCFRTLREHPAYQPWLKAHP
jgi:peptidoglycan/xylan/chitin deacetylase (PgdA/CDA1 family)